MEAAARASGSDPALANLAGALCRRAALLDRAGVWYARAARLAVKARSRREAIWAQLGYGALMKELGRRTEAREWFRRAAKRALRTGRRREAAEAFHDLLALAVEGGRIRAATRYGALAARFYPLWHPNLPYLAHDFAFLLLRCHQYSLAYSLLDAFTSVIPARHRLLGMGTLARAAAGRGLAHRFEEMESRIAELAAADDEHAPAAYIHLAEGARMLGRWSTAEEYAIRALAIGLRRQDHIIVQDARVFLAEIAERASPEVVTVPVDSATRILVREFAIRLGRWKSPPVGEQSSDLKTNPPAANLRPA
jgi:tetratricopeptide (TPR) repeat protein